MQPHSSHVIALSQACPNRVSGATLMYVIAILNHCFNFHFWGHLKFANLYICYTVSIITFNVFCLNLNRPLDLCDATSPNLDSTTLGSVYPGSHTNGITLPNHQGSVGPSTPTSNLNYRLPGSSGVVLGGKSSSPSALNTPR
jgi:hypothetical protein